VILSGGKSQRMGEDKSLLQFGSKNLAKYQYDKMSKIFKKVYISAKSNKFDFIDDTKIIFDTKQKVFAPLIALKSIFETLKSDIFIISVDTPFISYDTIKTILQETSLYDIVIPKSDSGTHNLCGFFSYNIASKIDTLLTQEIYKINYLIKQTNHKEIYFNNESEFLNLNTKEVYKEALAQIMH
jgi:molybdopterin-guanine dinucleotide biosynthesis protein A